MSGALPSEDPASNPAPAPQAPDEPVSKRPIRRGARTKRAAAWLLALLILLVAGVATVPFWAPPVTPLLPWGQTHAADRERVLAERLTALEQQNAALKSAQAALARRLGDSTATLAEIRSGLAGLGQRVDALAGQAAARPTLDPAALSKLQQEIASLGPRVDALAARPTLDPAALQQLRQQVAGIGRRTGDLASRIASLETRMAAPLRTADRDAALLVALLQMREGLDAAQPFAAPYAAFLALAQGRPKFLAAAQPLAAFAHGGTASRAALARNLAHLAGPIATARTPAPADDWGGRVLDQLRRLVTIRRVGDGHETLPEAIVTRAQADLARGDLAAAVQAIAALSGPPAAVAQPWLTEARRRLAAETALARLQQELEGGIVQRGAPSAAAPDHPTQPRPEPGAQ